MENKKWWKSKTVLVAIIGLVGNILQMQFGFVIDPETQNAILLVIFLVLRIITNEPIVSPPPVK